MIEGVGFSNVCGSASSLSSQTLVGLLEEHSSFASFLEAVATVVGQRLRHDSAGGRTIPSRRVGRPSTFTPELSAALCAQWIEAGSMQPVLDARRISRSTIWRWKRRSPEFRLMCRFTQAYLAAGAQLAPELWGEGRRVHRRVSKRLLAGIIAPVGAPERGRGRPTKYRSELLERVKQSWSATAVELGVSRRTVGYWCQRYPEFRRIQLIRSTEMQLPRLQRRVRKLCEAMDNSHMQANSGLEPYGILELKRKAEERF